MVANQNMAALQSGTMVPLQIWYDLVLGNKILVRVRMKQKYQSLPKYAGLRLFKELQVDQEVLEEQVAQEDQKEQHQMMTNKQHQNQLMNQAAQDQDQEDQLEQHQRMMKNIFVINLFWNS
jgi:hypothetical protein